MTEDRKEGCQSSCQCEGRKEEPSSEDSGEDKENSPKEETNPLHNLDNFHPSLEDITHMIEDSQVGKVTPTVTTTVTNTTVPIPRRPNLHHYNHHYYQHSTQYRTDGR